MTSPTRSIQDNESPAAGKWRLPLALALVAILTLAVYWPVLHNGFISYDDTDYVTTNMAVRQGLTLDSIRWAFSAFHAGNWHPLTWLSHMVDIELFDLNPMGHHLSSLILHTVNAVLLCALLRLLTGRLGASVMVALLFALHPLHVESVAWVAERKDVLSTLFWLLTMLAYAAYARRPGMLRYLAVAACLALGLMAKQMLVTLPVVLLLMDYWPLQRFDVEWKGIKPLLLEKIPLLLLAMAAALVTLRSQDSAGALGSHAGGTSFLLQSGNALLSYVKYLRNMCWPVDLAIFYPLDPSAVTPLKVAAAVLILAALTAVAFWQRARRPYLLFGWLWYLVTLLPVIGFIRIGSQALADRYTYVPLIGIFVILAWGGAELAARWRGGFVAACCASTVVLCILGALTVKQIRYWQNSFDLFSHALAAVDDNWLAHNNLGIVLAQNRRPAEAIRHFRESVRLNPEGADGYRNLGNAYQMTGNNTQACEAFRQAISINPADVESHYRLGYAYLISGKLDLAYQEYLQLAGLDEERARPLLDSIRMAGRR